MMNAISLKEYGERDRIAWRIEPGFQFAFKQSGGEAWLQAVMPNDQAAKMMRDIEMTIGVRGELEGFTLFYHPGKGWQMSTRRKGETGWSIQQGLVDEQVRPIFDLLEPIDHPDGPLQVKHSDDMNDRVLAGLAAEEGPFSGLTAAILARLAS